jgi:hypothetical protein
MVLREVFKGQIRKEALIMIFRHFLSPATGCASYVFG